MPQVEGYIERKSMLYKTGVEYGDYTINFVQGCAHGCKYPCYAFSLKKRFGQVKIYEEWLKPYLVSNTIEILDREIPRLKDKIQKISNEVREIGEITERSVQAAQIQRVNSMIVGLAQYLQPSICSHAFHAIDRRINNTALAVWKRRFPKQYNKYQIPLEMLCNLPHRHEGYKSKTFAVPIEGEWFGITYAFITHSKYESKPFDQRMTPYSEEGRRIYSYYRSRSKPLPCDRPSVNTAKDIQLSVYAKTVFNFEYFMNREYAYNRDNGKCKCCKTPLFLDNKKYCYHIKGELPLDKVNKVQNLIWICNSCYRMVNNGPIPPNIDEKVLKRIEKYKQK